MSFDAVQRAAASASPPYGSSHTSSQRPDSGAQPSPVYANSPQNNYSQNTSQGNVNSYQANQPSSNFPCAQPQRPPPPTSAFDDFSSNANTGTSAMGSMPARPPPPSMESFGFSSNQDLNSLQQAQGNPFGSHAAYGGQVGAGQASPASYGSFAGQPNTSSPGSNQSNPQVNEWEEKEKELRRREQEFQRQREEFERQKREHEMEMDRLRRESQSQVDNSELQKLESELTHLRENTVAKLKVEVLAARNLLPGTITGVRDPYAVIIVDNQKEKTTVIKKTIHPTWNVEFSFYVENPNWSVEVSIYDRNKLKHDDFLGRVIVPIKQLQQGVRRESWLALQPKKAGANVSGEIRLAFLLIR